MNTIVYDVYRHGRGRVFTPGRASRNAEMMPTRESMRRRYHKAWGICMKEPRESFVALRRYLDKQVGRRWDDVYSEIRERFDGRAWRNARVLEKVSRWVATTGLYVDNGQVMSSFDHGLSLPPVGLYAHPQTGLLCSSVVQLPPAAKKRGRDVKPVGRRVAQGQRKPLTW